MPNLLELFDTVIVTNSGHDENKIWFSSIDKNMHTATYHYLTVQENNAI